MKTRLRLLLAAACAALLAASCATPPPAAPAPTPLTAAEPVQLLSPGDTVRIAFVASPNLDTTQQIRRDGRLNLPMIGEIRAAGLTPTSFESELRRLYADQLRTNDVTVTVASSSFTVFVTGAVIRPGRLNPDRAITALDAVMQAGGFDPAKADLRRVLVIRNRNGHVERTQIDLRALLDGENRTPLYLESYDIVHVPERLVWF